MPLATYRTMRRAGIALACALSVLLGIALVWRFVTRDALARITTLELLAVLGLFVLPWAASAAVWMERTRGGRAGAAEDSGPAEFVPMPTEERVMRPAAYTVRERRNHRRRVVHTRARVE